MSSGDSTPKGLSDVSHRELRELVHAIDVGWISAPYTASALRQTSVDPRHIPTLVTLLEPCNAINARNLLEAIIAERVHRPPPRLELVWTGPETRDSTARDTAVIVRQLFERASHSVIIGGFRFDHGAAMFRALHTGMQRGLSVTMFVDIERRAETADSGPAYAHRAIDELLRVNWPFGPPYPAVHYDPRSAVPGPPWVSMHAKCIVVDDHWVFITSANFTERGQTRNLEVGVCIEDPAFAGQLAAQWRGLVTRGLVVRHT
ncbi:MAG: hypothetical protein RL701_2566 [Pseudomonadota bacterium]